MANAVCYHYTSAEALFQIVRSTRFRLGNVFFMNDYMEYRWLWRLALEDLEHRRAKASTQAERDCLECLQAVIGKVGFEYVFCGSFSSLGDDLSQWRGYARDGRGVVLGVDLGCVVDANGPNVLLTRSPVIYKEDTHKSQVNSAIAQFLSEAQIAYSGSGGVATAIGEIRCAAERQGIILGILAAICKNPAFEAEQEVRLLLKPFRDDRSQPKEVFAASSFRGFPFGVEFYHKGDRLVPYADIRFPLEAIRSIMLGPRFGGDMDKAALQLFLSREGVAAEVVRDIKRSAATYGVRAPD